MGIILKRGRDGSFRLHWYGKYDVDGHAHVFNLAVPVAGKAPPTLRNKGDAEFEKSRKDAEKQFIIAVERARQRGRAEHLVERLIEMKTGQTVEHVTIAELADRWLSMPRNGILTPAYVAGIKSACTRFQEFMRTRKREGKPTPVYLYEVAQNDAGSFADRLRSKLSARTAKGYTAMLRSAFRRFLPPGVANPFEGIVTRKNRDTSGEESVHRKPFTADELTRLLDASKEDSFLHPLIVTAACTGMRRGDVCRLKWQEVDLKAGMVTVKTSKTGAQVEIPIFSPLRKVLDAAGESKTGEYVFPAAAAMIQENPDGLTWRFKVLVARAFAEEKAEPGAPPPETAAVLSEGLAAIDCMPEGQRRDHTREAFTRYMTGASVRQIAKDTGTGKASVSCWLSDVSGMIGKPVVRNRTEMDIKAGIKQHTRVAREKGHGQRAASVRDWHALRSTWVTLALTAGVPMELVRRVTGHATVDVVLRHYFRPGREEFKKVLIGALPAVLTGGEPTQTPAEEVQAIADRIAKGTATAADRKRLPIVAAQLK